MKKLLNLLVIAVVITAVALPGFAQAKCEKHKEMSAHKEACATMMKDLKLTEKQQAEIDKIKKSCMESHKDFHAKLAKLGEEKSKLMAAEKPDKKAIGKVIDKMAEISAAVKKICVDCKLKIRALLTPEQLKKFNEMKEKCCKHKASCQHKACCSHGHKEHHAHKENHDHKDTKKAPKGCSEAAAGCSPDCVHK
jgi:Spy/CpxP family protein refolding chaperone